MGDCKQRNRHADQQSRGFGLPVVKSDTQEVREWHKLSRFLAHRHLDMLPANSSAAAARPPSGLLEQRRDLSVRVPIGESQPPIRAKSLAAYVCVPFAPNRR
jgi:hypothetical protein